jgi:DNA helicase HerA-like ATPase
VVGAVLRAAFREKEQSAQARPLQFIVLDELNKYAPREGSSPIKEILLDVAERGRSLGIILIGAQQTASEVERRIVSNSAIRVVGRLDAAEASRGEYGFLPTVHRQRATIIKPGTMIVSQPQLPMPLVVEFPFPAWATRPSEARRSTAMGRGGAGDPEDSPDVFEGLDA